MKKRMLAAIMAMTMVVGMLATGCGGSNKETSDGGDIEITVATRYSNDNPDENYY